jgi:intracellular multiplication protein IcmO
MALDPKYEFKHTQILRDGRPLYVRMGEFFMRPDHSFVFLLMIGVAFHFEASWVLWADLFLLIGLLYVWWLKSRNRSLAFKMPMGAPYKDDKSKDGKPSGILYLGNTDPYKEEVWFSNSDARTHILYLGTTGSGKTEGLKSMATNAMAWASGFVYVDGKADTDLWSSLSSLVRRFGRDDDLLILNYMTGNSDKKAPSNSMNPFSSGSASYLTQMLVSLMPDAEGDNAMWKERAVSLLGALMPALTWKRDNQDVPMSVGTIRQYLTLANVVKLSRDEALPEKQRRGLKGYLETLPGFVDAAFDDDGRDKPMGPDQPMIDTTTAKTQHGYLSMQFTRSLQSLADDYGYIFDSQAADVDMLDVVLNRRVLIVLIPALEKSGDETANLGKIVAATIKGMMGSTLGATVEGESATVIENKPTHSSTPFMTIFDEVGYYTAQGMAVMAAQARSLGFCLVFAAQDLPSLEKRVKEEARSIAANCNIKIFGKLEDPTQTKEFFEKTVGTSFVTEVSGFATEAGSLSKTYYDNYQAGVQNRMRASYDGVRAMKEGQAVIAFSERVVDVKIFYSNPGHAKAMRVARYLALAPPDETLLKHKTAITKLRDLMVKKGWSAEKADVALQAPAELIALKEGVLLGQNANKSNLEKGILGMVSLYSLNNPLPDKVETPPPQAKQVSAEDTPSVSTAAIQNAVDSLVAQIQAGVSQENDTTSTDDKVQPSQTQAPAKGGNPLSFFGAKKPSLADLPREEDASASANPPPDQSLKDLLQAPEFPESNEDIELQEANLDEDSKDIIRKAAEDAQKQIFKSSSDDTDKN